MAYLRAGIDGGRQGSSLVRNRVTDIRGDLATGGRLVLSTTEPTVVDGNELGRIDFQAPLDTAGTDAILVAASIYAEADATFSSSVNATELVFATGASETAAEKMRIDSAGNVGIGVATPDSLLEVSGADESQIKVTGTSGVEAVVRASASTATIGTNSNHNLYVRTNNSARMTILAAGNVGIGTTTPQTHLEVHDTSAIAELLINGGGTGACAALMFGARSASGGNEIGRIHGIRGGDTTGQMVFSVKSAADTITEAMRITSTGKVGIGTTAPAYDFDVNVTSASWGHRLKNSNTDNNVAVFGHGGGSACHIRSDTAGASNYLMNLYDDGDRFNVWGDGQVDVNGSQVHAASDERLKQNITTITGSLDKINNMRGVRYQWIESEDERYSEHIDLVTGETIPDSAEYRRYHLGLIAQEVEEYWPELINERVDGMKVLADGNEFSAILIEAVKELSAKNDALEAKVTVLENA